MEASPPRIEMMLRGDPDTPKFKETVAVLDRSGLSYRVIHDLRGQGEPAPLLVWGDETLSDFSHGQLVGFLWDHGARFEDS
jgi:hypothetical protein